MLYLFLAIFLIIVGGINYILSLDDFEFCETDTIKSTIHIILMIACFIMCGFNIARFFYGV